MIAPLPNERGRASLIARSKLSQFTPTLSTGGGGMAVLARSIFEFRLPPVRQLNVKTGLIHQCQLDCFGDGFGVRTIEQEPGG